MSRAAFDEVLRAAICVGCSQVYTDHDPERLSWLEADQAWLDNRVRDFWRTLDRETK